MKYVEDDISLSYVSQAVFKISASRLHMLTAFCAIMDQLPHQQRAVRERTILQSVVVSFHFMCALDFLSWIMHGKHLIRGKRRQHDGNYAKRN